MTKQQLRKFFKYAKTYWDLLPARGDAPSSMTDLQDSLESLVRDPDKWAEAVKLMKGSCLNNGCPEATQQAVAVHWGSTLEEYLDDEISNQTNGDR